MRFKVRPQKTWRIGVLLLLACTSTLAEQQEPQQVHAPVKDKGRPAAAPCTFFEKHPTEPGLIRDWAQEMMGATFAREKVAER